MKELQLFLLHIADILNSIAADDISDSDTLQSRDWTLFWQYLFIYFFNI